MQKYFSKAKIQYMFYVLTHPMDGFYEIRHREKGSVPLAILTVILFSISYTIRRMCASFIVNDINPRTVDLLSDLQGVLVIFFLFCIGNWSITCLMNGEGRLKDIVTVVGYSLLPMVLTYLPATLLSLVLSDEEVVFYSIIIWLGTAWSVILAIIGIMVVHNYTSGKTLITLILTILAMLVIMFILMMIFTLLQQVYGFLYSIYTELQFRT